jgi:ADP-heptose:LPS heptosyltransferase
MAVPVAAAIRERYPEGEIVWAVEPRCAAVIDTKRLVNELALFPRDDWERHRWSPATWCDQLRTYFSMRKQPFDIGIDLHGQGKTALCLRIANPKKRIAVKGHDVVSKRLNPILDVSRGEMHVVDHSMLALSELGDFPKEVRFVMPELKDEKQKVSALLPSGKVATISVAAGSARKTYPAERWATVARCLQERGFGVAFLGGPGDTHIEVPGTVDLIGKLPLVQSMAAVALSTIHLAADTGTGHMAAAYNVPVVSIFGPTKISWYRPYTSNGIALDGNGSPANVEPEQILEATEQLLQRQSEAISR